MASKDIKGTGGVGNDELIRDFGGSSPSAKVRRAPKNVFRIHAAVRVPSGAADVISQMIVDGDLEQLIPYVMAKGEIIRERKKEYEARLTAVCKYFAAVPASDPHSKPIPGEHGLPSLRVIKDFVPGNAVPQAWFELRIIVPIKAGSDGDDLIADLHNAQFAEGMKKLRDKAGDVEARIPHERFKRLINELYSL